MLCVHVFIDSYIHNTVWGIIYDSESTYHCKKPTETNMALVSRHARSVLYNIFFNILDHVKHATIYPDRKYSKKNLEDAFSIVSGI